VKNTRIADVAERLGRYGSETSPGRIHDKRIGEGEEPGFPPGSGLFQAPRFQGYHPSGVTIYQPKKKPKGQELTPAEKGENQLLSSIRILVEHILAGIKRGRIVKDILRNTQRFFAEQVMEIACGLHNFRPTLRRSTTECSELSLISANVYSSLTWMSIKTRVRLPMRPKSRRQSHLPPQHWYPPM
jgi:DDE superfamily endonuclease